MFSPQRQAKFTGPTASVCPVIESDNRKLRSSASWVRAFSAL